MTDVELVKSKIDIVSFISDYIQVKKAGRNFKALCPFHSEKSPSFIISPERGSWHCFGACGEGGDALKFLQKWENIDFLEALKILAKKTGVTLSNFTPTAENKKREILYEINHMASEFYHYLLTSHKLGKRALEYLKGRGIKEETIKTFKLGYAPESWDSLHRFLLKKGYESFDCNKAGLIIRSDGGKLYDRFRGRLMFALHDHRGNIAGFSGRLLDEVHPESLDSARDKLQRGAKYVNTSETPIYIKGNILYGLQITRDSIKKANEAIVVEGEFDLLSSFQIGVTNVVAIKGSALTEGQTLLLKRFTDQLILALDSDFAGNEAAKRGIEIAENAGLSVKVAKITEGKAPADCISINRGIWKKAVKSSVPIYDFIIENAFEKNKGKDASDKKKISDEIIPFLSKIENSIIFSHYLKMLARKLDVSEESVETAIRQFQKKRVVEKIVPGKTLKTSRDILLEEYLLALIAQSKEPCESAKFVLETITISDLNQPAIARIIELLSLFCKTNKDFDVGKFGTMLTAEIASHFDRAILIDIENIISDKAKFDKEIAHTAREIKKISLRRRLNIISTKIKEKEEKDDEDAIKTLQQELRQLLSQLNEVDISIPKG